jgi:hypothetical protein
MKKYKPEAEGSVFDKRSPHPPTPAELEELLSRDPFQSVIDECEALAVNVLANHFGKPVKIIKGEVIIDGKAQLRPLPGQAAEVVLDAFDMADICRSVRSLEGTAVNPIFEKSTRVRTVRMLANCCQQVGRLYVQMMLRLEGVESKVFRRERQTSALEGRRKIDIDPAALRKAWERVQYEMPNASRMTWREMLGRKFQCSESTIERRLRVEKII